jgi:hypothetical protein
MNMKKLLYACLLLNIGCISFFSERHDPQLIQIDFRYGKGEKINTFSGELVKDLIPGTARTTFWFTKHEQDLILAKVDSLDFYDLPDTINIMSPSVIILPSFGPSYFRIKHGDRDKTVMLYDFSIESDKMPIILRRITMLVDYILQIAYSKAEYKSLPKRKGAYI